MSTTINETTNGKVSASLLPAAQSSTRNANAAAKYRPFPPVGLRDRTWPDKQIDKAPMWCSVDLRDGNQALAIPMNLEEKLEMFEMLVAVGFKEIEVGFPSASEIEFEFCRKLIEEDRVPNDVSIQVLVQAREELIRRSFEALRGAKNAIMHMYNSTNPSQRKIVFGLSKEQIKEIAIRGTTLIRQLADEQSSTRWTMEYSPESFVLTELEYSLEICEAVADVWRADAENKLIMNLPTTVESSTPNVHADQIEWFCRNLRDRKRAIVSLHTHNDRGTGVASTELALLAGAERVEGTLFGNGERTGNLDVVTVALNMFSQGVDSQLDFSDLPRIRETYERNTRMVVHERHPYAGDLVFTAFSGSHQDAIAKGFASQDPSGVWEVPYLPLDPHDIGRDYEAIIRTNTQSGKGGFAFLLEQNYGFELPKSMKVEFGKIMQKFADAKGTEVFAEDVYNVFKREYLDRQSPIKLEGFRSYESDILDESSTRSEEDVTVSCRVKLLVNGEEKLAQGKGNGPIEAFVKALRNIGVNGFEVVDYSQKSLGGGAQARAVSYIEMKSENGKSHFGAGVDTSIELASIKAVVSALNRSSS
jgi:2-isopropylmalate synthase